MMLTCPRALFASLLLILAACGAPIDSDAGPDATSGDGGTDSGGMLCAADRDCNDGLFCNGDETCAPGAPGSGVDGCVAGTAPCADSSCDEGTNTCSCGADSDADGDGHDSIACGGDDCDDADPNRYPGNEEVCDAEGHDEDCDPTTVGGTDADADGYVDAACCNGDVCGEDCDDSTRSVAPSASDVCDGIDNDCDESIDEASTIPLCPGGTCAAGICSFSAWDRTWGGGSGDLGNAVDFDALGRVFVAGTTQGGFVLEGNSVAPNQLYVAAFEADGTLRWVYRTTDATSQPLSLQVAAASDGSIYVGGLRNTTIDFGDGPVTAPSGGFSGSGYSGFVARLLPDGTFDWARTIDTGNLQDLGVLADGSVVVSGAVGASYDFGGGLRSVTEQHGYVAVYETTGAWRWDALLRGNTSLFSTASPRAVYVGGSWASGELEVDGTVYTPDSSDFLLVEYDHAGALVGHAVYSQAGFQQVSSVTVDGAERLYLGGQFQGSATWAGETVESQPSTSLAGFVLALQPDWSARWVREIDGEGIDAVHEIAADSADDIVVAGLFHDRIDFGAGLRGRAGGRFAYAIRYAPTGVLRTDNVLLYELPVSSGVTLDWAVGPGRAVAVTGMFTGTVDLGSGDKSSVGGTDAFVIRLGD